jgi:hypothetical protein
VKIDVWRSYPKVGAVQDYLRSTQSHNYLRSFWIRPQNIYLARQSKASENRKGPEAPKAVLPTNLASISHQISTAAADMDISALRFLKQAGEDPPSQVAHLAPMPMSTASLPKAVRNAG